MFVLQVSLGGGGRFPLIRAPNPSRSWPEMEFCLKVQKKMSYSPQNAN